MHYWAAVPDLSLTVLRNTKFGNLLGIYPKEVKTYGPTKTCMKMSTATLFTIAENWKHSNDDQWVRGYKISVHLYNGLLLLSHGKQNH